MFSELSRVVGGGGTRLCCSVPAGGEGAGPRRYLSPALRCRVLCGGAVAALSSLPA